MRWLLVFCFVPLACGLGLYPVGGGSFPPSDEVSSPPIPLSVPVIFYGTSYDSIFVNDNGILSFVRDVPSFYNVQFPLTSPVIAPFYSDIDLRRGGNILYGELDEPAALERASREIRENFGAFGDFQAIGMFTATYANVSHYKSSEDVENEVLKVNSFQVVIVSDGKESFVTFMYPEGGIQSIRGEGKIPNLPDPRAQAGFMSGDGRLDNLPDSGTDRVFNYDKESNLRIPIPGVWMFRVGSVRNVEPASIKLPDISCRSRNCPPTATCTAGTSGSCCVCNEGYYGDGNNCFKENEAQRINGKITGFVNNVLLDNLDLHAYVNTDEGRSYAAISKVPQDVGSDIRSLLSIGDGIGWLFSKAQGIQNGFSVTGGVMNRTVDIEFTGSGERVTISEQYLGPDVFNYLKVNIDIRGSLPKLSKELKVEINDFSEDFTQSSSPSSGVSQLRSRSNRIIRTESSHEVPFVIDQVIIFSECPFLERGDRSKNSRLEVSNTVLIYEDAESIVRFAGNYKLSALLADDPCKAVNCQDHASCVVDGDQARCVCDRGFRGMVQEDGSTTCIDVDECSTGRHRCHSEAECINLEGSYQCNCRNGFSGDGYYCQQKLTCDELQCDVNGECSISEVTRGPECRCRDGYKGNGYFCQFEEVDKCDTPCATNGICTLNRTTNTYGCACLPGSRGDGITCIPITAQLSELEDSTKLDCKVNERLCSQDADCSFDLKQERFVCHCIPGFIGNGLSCRPLMDCRLDSDCQTNSHCHFSMSGTGYCDCNPGYNRSSGGSLEPMCQPLKDAPCNLVPNCHEKATCIFDAKLRVYKCQCRPGYKGDGREVCEKSVIPCNIINNCDVRASCEYSLQVEGFRCQCMDGYKGDGSWCQPIRPCNEDPRQCDMNAVCEPSPSLGTYACHCRKGFVGDGLKCSEAPSHDGNYLIYTQGMSFLRLPLNPTVDDPGQLLMVHPKQIPVGLDVDCLQGTLYWSDLGLKAIRRAPYNGSRFETLIEGPLVGSPEGIAVDWISRNVYWIDSQGDTIKVTRLDGRLGPKTLISEGLKDPRGIVVHPGHGKMYFSDWNRGAPKIEVSNLDGSERSLFVTEGLSLPNSLAIDFLTNDLCWTDAGHMRIECMDLSGRSRRVIFTPANYPFSLTLAMDNLYWTDWKTNSVEKVSKFGGIGSSVPLPRGGNGKVYGITTIPRECPQMSNACANQRGGCGHLCLPDGRGGRTCTCPDSEFDDDTSGCREFK